MRNNESPLANIDWWSVLLFFALVLMGWGNIYAAVYNEESESILDFTQRYGKQLIWILTSLGIILFIFIIDGAIFSSLAYAFYGFGLLLLIGLFIFGKEIAGAQSWYAFGGFSLQPSEFTKCFTALAIAKYASQQKVDFKKFRYQVGAFVLAFLPALLIVPQPDPGSALVYTAFILVLYREGLPGIYLWTGFGLALLFILSLLIEPLYLMVGLLVLALLGIWITRKSKRFFWRILALLVLCVGFIQTVDYVFYNVLEDRHRNRINIVLGKAHDPKGIGYNTNQSLIAIGSGGFSGKGYLEGTQTKFDFVPEQSTDFIFCTVGEEWGFLGSSVLILLFLAFFFRLVQLAERQKSTFARVYGYSVVCILFVHFSINIAMTIGLAPVIGIPLPFFSYGGSSLWGFTLLLFIFLKLDAYRWQILR